VSATTASARGETSNFGSVRPRASSVIDPARIAISDLDFCYGDHRALIGIKLDLADRQAKLAWSIRPAAASPRCCGC
jgi:phosphate transport system ATP-binding protein